MKRYLDDFFTIYKNTDDMRENLKSGDYIEVKLGDIQITDIPNLPICEYDVASKFDFEIGGSDEVAAIRDTMDHTQLVATIKIGVTKKNFLIRDTALSTLFERAKISGQSLYNMEKSKLAKLLNDCLKLWKKQTAKVYVSDNKISAILSFDFKPLRQEDLFERLLKTLQKDFPGYIFSGGYQDHSMTLAKFFFPNQQKDILKVYEKAFTETSKSGIGKVGLYFATSDVGISGVNMKCVIQTASYSIPLGSAITLHHKGNSDIEAFEENLTHIYSKMKENVELLTALLDVQIENPVNALTAIAKKLTLPKKSALDAIKIYEDTTDKSWATAHELYCVLCEIITFERNNKSGFTEKNQFLLEEKIARALTTDWTKYDFAKSVVW